MGIMTIAFLKQYTTNCAAWIQSIKEGMLLKVDYSRKSSWWDVSMHSTHTYTTTQSLCSTDRKQTESLSKPQYTVHCLYTKSWMYAWEQRQLKLLMHIAFCELISGVLQREKPLYMLGEPGGSHSLYCSPHNREEVHK